jgi:hypothetical protein
MASAERSAADDDVSEAADGGARDDTGAEQGTERGQSADRDDIGAREDQPDRDDNGDREGSVDRDDRDDRDDQSARGGRDEHEDRQDQQEREDRQEQQEREDRQEQQERDDTADGDEREDTGDGDDRGDRDEVDERADEAGDGAEPALPPVAAVELSVLLDEYWRADTGRRPWNWAALPPEHREALVELVDRFVDSYNRVWAMTDDQVIPPCWHRHPALAYDLAALVWTFHGAYRDGAASPEAALRFQDHVVSFAGRLDRWLGRGARDCRDGRHERSWRSVRSRGLRPDRNSLEYADEIALLGVEHFGFEPDTPTRPGDEPHADSTP